MQRSQDAESLYSRATRSELARDYDSAFRLYVKAAESFIHLSSSPSATERDKSQWNNNANRALERAERIKEMAERSRPSPSSSEGTSAQSEQAPRLTPVIIDYFSPEEQSYVLKRGGRVNGMVFPLWREDPGPSSVQKQPRFSSLQAQFSAIWRAEDRDVLAEDRSVFPRDISQNIVTDCSVCASISSCIEHGIRFRSNLAKSIIHPSSSISAHRGSSYPLYDLKLLFNGDWRRIRIDGQLPYHPNSGVPLCLTCKLPDADGDAAQTLLTSWPSILEKGYMVLMGGYDFPGSNSAIDLHTLTGWIPEHIDIKRSNFEEEKTWTRIAEGFGSGRCMLTFGTGPNPNIRWSDKKFLATHCYAAIDVRETENGRFVTILDSWGHSETPDITTFERPGLLNIPWSDVLDIFEGIYLNWDPNMWSSRLTYHALVSYDRQSKFCADIMLYTCTHQVRAKFHATNSEERDELWVLLTRHVHDTRNTGTFIACQVQIEDDEVGCSIVCDKQKLSNRVRISTRFFASVLTLVDRFKGIFTNSPHVLGNIKTRMRIPPLNHSASLSIFAICDDASEDVGFDVTIYASKHLKLAWEKDIIRFPFIKMLEGTLTNNNSGGNHTHPTFMINPQYHLRVHPYRESTTRTKKRTTIVVETNKELPIQVMICWSQGERVNEPSQKNIVATSGVYTRGLARVTTQLSPGHYSVIISAFEPSQTGSYTLTVNSFAEFDIGVIPQEGAGMYRKTVKGAWDATSAAGAPSFNRYFKNPIYELNLPAQARVQIRLQLLRPSSSISLNVTVYSVSEHPSSDGHVATSGPYDDAITGVVTPLTSLPSGRFWVVPSTYNPGTQSDFQLIVFSTLAPTELKARSS
ncbi:hypothetical protein GYMLUDRAFT_53518 [Collybiopsis luxurians FD-317 M1]|nr:hypothetical protein GYMLUDRAFT_53518 [Collybiopsis luxurians FD-317 M1]